MELIVGDLVKHNVHGWWGIVLTNSYNYSGGCLVCKVEWFESGKSHLIDVNFLDKQNNTC